MADIIRPVSGEVTSIIQSALSNAPNYVVRPSFLMMTITSSMMMMSCLVIMQFQL